MERKKKKTTYKQAQNHVQQNKPVITFFWVLDTPPLRDFVIRKSRHRNPKIILSHGRVTIT